MKLIVQFDNLDDRRELYRQFAALPPECRYRFVDWACTLAKLKGTHRPALVMDDRSREAIAQARRGDAMADRRITSETWGFLLVLTATWGVPLDLVAKSLESVARGRTSMHKLASTLPAKSS